MDTAAVLSTSFTQPLRSVRTVTASVSLNKATIFPSDKKKAVMLTSRSRRQRKAWKTPCSGKLISTIICGAISEITEKEFRSRVLESDRPVLVEFIATWCGPCRLISPAMEWVAQEYDDKLTVVKIDHDANPQLIEEYKVYGLPTLILFKNGQEVPESRREGAITKAKLKEYVDGLLEQVSAA